MGEDPACHITTRYGGRVRGGGSSMPYCHKVWREGAWGRIQHAILPQGMEGGCVGEDPACHIPYCHKVRKERGEDTTWDIAIRHGGWASSNPVFSWIGGALMTSRFCCNIGCCGSGIGDRILMLKNS